MGSITLLIIGFHTQLTDMPAVHVVIHLKLSASRVREFKIQVCLMTLDLRAATFDIEIKPSTSGVIRSGTCNKMIKC